MTVDYAVYLYNHLPNEKDIAPAALFTGVTSPRHKLRAYHVWGAPVYVLDPKSQAGQKLPRWQPSSPRGMFVGFSLAHSNDVLLILNLRTKYLSPQYHVVFDDDFSTVDSLASDSKPPSFWNTVDLEQNALRSPLGNGSNAHHDKDWLTPAELEERSRSNIRLTQIRKSFRPNQTLQEGSQESNYDVLEEPSDNIPSIVEVIPPSILDFTSDIPPHLAPRRSIRSNKGSYQTAKYINEVFLTSVADNHP